MNIVEAMVVNRVEKLLKDLEVLAEDMTNTVNEKSSSQKVSDFTTAGEISPENLKRLGRIQLEVTLLKGLV